MQTIQQGNYGGTISLRKDGSFTTFFLYNMNTEPDYVDNFSKGDVWDMKTYKTEKMAKKKIQAFIDEQTA